MSVTAPALLAAAAGVGFGHAVLPDHWVPLSVIARTQRYPLRRVLRLSGLAGLAHVALSLILGAILIGVGLQFRTTVERHENLIVGGLLLATGAVFLILQLLGHGHGHSHGHDHAFGHGDKEIHANAHQHATNTVTATTSTQPQPTYNHSHSHDDDHGHDPEHTHSHLHTSPTVAVSTGAQHKHHLGRTHRREKACTPQHSTTVAASAPHTPSGSRSRATRLLAFAVPFGAAASPDLTILPVFLAASALGLTAALGTLVVFSLVTLATIVGLTMLGTLVGYQLRGAWIDKSANLITAAALLLIGVLIATNTI